jgi:hypothetical protein
MKDDDDDREEKDKLVLDRLLLPNRIGEAVNSALWLFVFCGFLLNVNGYGYVVKDHTITIDTLENRQFIIESRAKPSAPPMPSDKNPVLR